MTLANLDIDELRSSLPKQHRGKLTPEFIGTISQLATDPDYADLYARNIITYTSVMQEGRFKLLDYFNAVAFVSFKMLGLSSLKAYEKVFPDKVKGMAARNLSSRDMHSFASAYNKNKLVTLIYEQTLIPDHIMYASVRHKAIAAQAALLSSTNEHIVQKAADSLMNHLKAPENTKLSIEMGTKDSGMLADLTEALNNLSKKQSDAIAIGSHSVKDIAHSRIIEGELDD